MMSLAYNHKDPVMYRDKLGVYRVGHLNFYSKLEAIEMHTKTGIHPHWDFNEAVFDCYDWTQEPAASLPELYRQRAQQLRDAYDYLILMYSGGADSTNMLDAFLLNNIKIDELASFHNFTATGDRDSYLNCEIWRVVLPRIQRLEQTHPWIKHRMIDMTALTLDYFSQRDSKFDWIYQMNFAFSPSNVSRESLALKIPEWRRLIDQGKKVGVVWGCDKPRIKHHDDNSFSLHFIDLIDSSVTRNSMQGLLPYNDELFYWTPDLPQIVIKQAHTVKKFLQSVDPETSPWMTLEPNGLANLRHARGTYWLTTHGLHRLIYPHWDIDTFSAGKVRSVVFTPRDTWFFNMTNIEHIKRNWRMGLDKWWQMLPEHWRNTPGDISKNIKCCVSKNYVLGA